MSDDEIPHKYLMTGMNHCHDTARELYRSARFLYDNEKYRTSIILSTHAIEESNKFHNMFFPQLVLKPFSKKNWKDMHNHKIKNSKPFNDYLKKYENLDDRNTMNKKFELIAKIFPDLTDALSPITDEDIFKTKKIKNITDSLHKLKMYCLYTDWDNSKKTWFDIKIYSEFEIKRLSIFLLNTSISYLKLSSILLKSNDEFNVSLKRIPDSSLKKLDIVKLFERLNNYKSWQV